MQAWSDETIRRGKTIAFVPTMGFLHEGHLAVMREGLRHGDKLVVSIFVNPTQFGPEEDLEAYPRNFSRDSELCLKEGVDILFAPEASDLYTEYFQAYVSLKEIPHHLCGISRPIHFTGVATVIAKFFNIVKPNFAIFGQKDFQQLLVIKQMTIDLNFPVEIIGVPTVRETDGLALSSRNKYLKPEQRPCALSLYKSLNNSMKMVASGIKNSGKVINSALRLIKTYPEAEIDYISICDPETLVEKTMIDKPVLMAIAVKVGQTRLIDNMILNP